MSRIINTFADVTVSNIIAEIIEVEGGYVNHKNDRGGETKYGITKGVAYDHRHLWSKYQFNGDMRELPKALAYDIYFNQYWKKTWCDALYAIHPLLAYHMFDLAVNGGVGTAIRHLQRQLNLLNRGGNDYAELTVDGSIGNKTIQAVQQYAKRNPAAMDNFVLLLVMQQGEFYLRISESRPANESFTNGWMNRAANKMKLFCRLLATRQ